MASRIFIPVAMLALIISAGLPATGEAPTTRTSPYRAQRALVIATERYESGYWPDVESAESASLVACALKARCFDVELVVDSDRRSALHCPADRSAPACGHPGRLTVSRVERMDAATLSMRIRGFTTDASLPDASAQLVWVGGHGATHTSPWGEFGGEIVAPREGLLVAAGAPAPDHPAFLAHVVPIRELATWSRLSRAQHLLFVIESCFSGTVFEFRPELRPFLAWTAIMRSPARQFITAGGADQPVPEAGIFATRFVQAILGQWGCDPSKTGCDPDAPRSDFGVYRDGVLTASEVGRLLNVELGARSGGRQTPQWGALLDQRFDKGEFLFPVPFRFGEADVAELYGDGPATVPVRHCDRCPEVVAQTSEVALGVREVSFADWEECVTAGACSSRPHDHGWGGGRQPVIGVNLADTSEYLAWLNRQVDDEFQFRLPTPSEWRASAERYTAPANCVGCHPLAASRPLPAGWASRSPTYEPQDLVGNVWEWALACANGAAPRGEPDLPAQACSDGSDPRASVVGGAWANGPDLAHPASERFVEPSLRSSGVGFRVVVERNRGTRNAR